MRANRLIAAVLVCILLVPGAGAAGAQTSGNAQQAPPHVLEAIAKAARRGSWVQVVLRDKRVVSGSVIEADEDSFTLRRADTGLMETLTYPQVKKVKGCPTPAIVKVAAAAGAAVAFVYLFTKFAIPRT